MRRFLAVTLLLALGVVALVSWCYAGAVTAVDTAHKVVALTYDDGPNPPHTQALLALLESRGVRATFFLKGANAAAFPVLARQVQRAGHEIGNHGWSHSAMWSLNKTLMRDEVARTADLLHGVTGMRPALFRPPYGIQGPGLRRALAELGLPSILASASGADWEVFEPRAIADAILASVEPGGIILLHDGHGDVDDPRAQDSRAGSVEASAILIDELRSRGYRFVTVGELLAL
tara:strand:+ start:293 stop:991 length:699 start_codon:yes stop_codon:yes gene_type:complete